MSGNLSSFVLTREACIVVRHSVLCKRFTGHEILCAFNQITSKLMFSVLQLFLFHLPTLWFHLSSCYNRSHCNPFPGNGITTQNIVNRLPFKPRMCLLPLSTNTSSHTFSLLPRVVKFIIPILKQALSVLNKLSSTLSLPCRNGIYLLNLFETLMFQKNFNWKGMKRFQLGDIFELKTLFEEFREI